MTWNKTKRSFTIFFPKMECDIFFCFSDILELGTELNWKKWNAPPKIFGSNWREASISLCKPALLTAQSQSKVNIVWYKLYRSARFTNTRCAGTRMCGTGTPLLQPKPMSRNEPYFSERSLVSFNYGAPRRFLNFHPQTEIQWVKVAKMVS